MNLTCYIVDDEAHAVEALSRLVNAMPGLQLTGSTTQARTGFSEICSLRPDITFMDIDMQDMNGLALAALVKDFTAIIFTTAFREYAPEAFEVQVIDYLLKPVTTERLLKAIANFQRISSTHSNGDAEYLLLKTGIKNQLIKIQIEEIIYIAGASNYIDIHFAGHKTMAYLSLTEIMQKLPCLHFSRIHKSYIVNERFISRVEGNAVILKNGSSITIGPAYADSFIKKLAAYIVKSKWDH